MKGQIPMKPNVVVCSKGKCPIISLFQSFDNHEERLTTLFPLAKLSKKIKLCNRLFRI